jgi:hypothetical protein
MDALPCRKALPTLDIMLPMMNDVMDLSAELNGTEQDESSWMILMRPWHGGSFKSLNQNAARRCGLSARTNCTAVSRFLSEYLSAWAELHVARAAIMLGFRATQLSEDDGIKNFLTRRGSKYKYPTLPDALRILGIKNFKRFECILIVSIPLLLRSPDPL